MIVKELIDLIKQITGTKLRIGDKDRLIDILPTNNGVPATQNMVKETSRGGLSQVPWARVWARES